MPNTNDLPYGTFFRFLHAIILLALLSVALWDVSFIISNYMHENRVTLVRMDNVDQKGRFPFLNGESVQACLDYGGDTLLKEAWSNQAVKIEAKLLMNQNE